MKVTIEVTEEEAQEMRMLLYRGIVEARQRLERSVKERDIGAIEYWIDKYILATELHGLVWYI